MRLRQRRGMRCKLWHYIHIYISIYICGFSALFLCVVGHARSQNKNKKKKEKGKRQDEDENDLQMLCRRENIYIYISHT